ncbi:TIGR01458 family HAD-type hydrolase [Pseudorhodoferax sp.]|uniref:TIGR01458 family HAD-type hydrolase n=1 Tax=Pseudorhodoferax sp. TaxID=1993553 RepID=UPI0039E64EDA
MDLPSHPRALLIDLAGVLHVGSRAVAGAADALARARAAGLRTVFVTNTTRTPRRVLCAQMNALGFPMQENELVTAPSAAVRLVRARGWRPHWLVHPDLAAEVGPGDAAPDTVVMGDAGPYFDYAQLNAAFRLIHAGARFVAMARNRSFREEDGLSLDMGAFVAGLEYSTGVTAEITGKPAPAFFAAALALAGVPASAAVMVGDDVRDDIGGAQACGIAGMLVRTGKYAPGDERHAGIRPAAVVDDFAAAVRRLLAGG